MLPNFGTKDTNVKCRIMCLKTKSLQETSIQAEKWMRKNCMECAAWLTSEIERFKHLLDPTELWCENQ